jgi:hypothetical protein
MLDLASEIIGTQPILAALLAGLLPFSQSQTELQAKAS